MDETSKLVDLVDARCADGHELMSALRPALDRRELEPLVEYVAHRLRLESGERSLRFLFSDGNLRQTEIEHRRVGNSELERLGVSGR